MEKGTIIANRPDIDKLFQMAQSSEYDKHQREETYYVIAQVNRKDDIARFRKLLTDGDPFWRAVGLRCILRMDGKGQLKTALQDLSKAGSSSKKGDVREIVTRIASFPKLLPRIRELLDHSSVFVRAIAVNVLAEIGEAQDVKAVENLTEEHKRLPNGFEKKTLGEAARAAVEAIKQRG